MVWNMWLRVGIREGPVSGDEKKRSNTDGWVCGEKRSSREGDAALSLVGVTCGMMLDILGCGGRAWLCCGYGAVSLPG